MPVKTYEEQLEEVQQAISDVITGAQEASYNGQKVVKADLDMLQKREQWLLERISYKTRGGIKVKGATPY